MVQNNSGKCLKFIYSSIACVIVSCILFVTLEVGARYLFPNNDRLQEILRVLEQDSILFWRQRENLDTEFQKTGLKTNFIGLRDEVQNFGKKANLVRVICLGASPTFGWAVEGEDSYPDQLENMLNHNPKGKKIYEVINAGVIGYSSYQGLLFLKNELLRFDPDIITIAYGVNDMDKHRFYRSNGKMDKELYPKNRSSVFLENIFNNSKLVRVCRDFVLYLKGYRKDFSGIKGSTFSDSVRVSPQDYKNNLDEILKIAKKKGIKIIFIKMPMDLSLPEPISDQKKLKAEEYLSIGLKLIKARAIDQAIANLKKAAINNPYSSEVFYYLGMCYELEKDSLSAKDYFLKAKEAQAYQHRKDIQIYQDLMQQLADTKNIPCLDAMRAVVGSNNKSFFKTPIHPNASGHKIIAGLLYDALTDNDYLLNDEENRR
ncbi:MAG: hypothetical protein K9L86_00510 [Candidatus Omnitrophica bacterium]|nr:hypothetical protein [Candidatus Omnitrophota bacterium]